MVSTRNNEEEEKKEREEGEKGNTRVTFLKSPGQEGENEGSREKMHVEDWDENTITLSKGSVSSGERGTRAAALGGERNMNPGGVMNANITSSDVNVLPASETNIPSNTPALSEQQQLSFLDKRNKPEGERIQNLYFSPKKTKK